MARPYTLPEKEIKFAAKSGFLTRELWDEFFNSRTKGWSSIRWRGFQSRKIFRKHTSKLAENCLILNKASPDVQRLVGKKISSPPRVDYLYHDGLVARIILKLQKNNLLIDDDYHLRLGLHRIYKENGILESRKDDLHLPDAVFEMESNGRILRVALDMELERRDPLKYKKIIRSYSSSGKIDRVVIVHQGLRIKSSFERVMLRYRYPHYDRPILFIEPEDLFSGDYFLYFFRNTVLKG